VGDLVTAEIAKVLAANLAHVPNKQILLAIVALETARVAAGLDRLRGLRIAFAMVQSALESATRDLEALQEPRESLADHQHQRSSRTG
jgi:hypothetical protein